VSDEHIEDFLRGIGEWDDGWPPEERARQLDVHRRRSIHVHCWSQDEFLPVIEHTVTDMDMQWELLDAMFTEDFDGGFEFGFALRRSTVIQEPVLAAEHLATTWSLLESRALADRERADAIPALLAERQALRAHCEHANARLEQLRGLPGYAAARGVWRLARRARGGSAARPEQAHGGP
jgi:hypothetical protein